MRLAKGIGALTVAAIFCMSAMAQGPGGPGGGPGGGPQISEEALAKAWDAQAAGVAKQLTLNEEQTKKLAEAYKAARTSHGAAIRERMSSGERRDPGAFREVGVAERTKLETALKGFLNEEQTGKALTTLGSFNRRWDGMVVVLDGLGLEEKAKADAMNTVSTYIADSTKAIEEAMAAGSATPESMREKMAPMREKLDADMGKVLSADQLTKWKETTSMRGGGGRRGGGEGPREGGAPAAGAPATPATPDASSKKDEKKAE
ncbi:MAG: hypothetical protein SGI88_00725 [Candidatus Hydrogenedentes bacterium]|nr:hypothetical protein [Candidatus Hydrogenedentota bacterium]